MVSILNIIVVFWFLRTLKAVLFWVYLWQLKEYHFGRFIDHFRTHKGKQLIFNKLQIFKIVLLIFFFIGLQSVALVLLLIYILESVFFVIRKFRKPVWTKKAIVLVLAAVLLSVLYAIFAGNLTMLLIFDIFAPLIVSLIVLIFQPFFVYLRNNTLKKAKEKMAKFKNLTVIGITGSYGKTSTKEFLKTILSSKFSVLATPEHKNSEIGIAQNILEDLREGYSIFIVEMGAYKKGGIKLLCDIVHPKIGIVTGVNEQHLSTFGSMKNLLSAEGGQELARNLPKDGLLVLNGDNKYCLDLYKKTDVNSKIYALSNKKVDADIFAQEISVYMNSIDFIAIKRDKQADHFNVKVLGKQHIQNLLGAILVANELGMSFQEISWAVKKIKPEQAGMTLIKGTHNINIIDASYSSNPDGVMADLEYLKVFSGRKVVVMPCLIELKERSSDIHQDIGLKISEVCDMAIVTTKDKFQEIKKGAYLGGMNQNSVNFSDDPKEIFSIITTFCKEGDSVLLEGRVPKELIELLIKNG